MFQETGFAVSRFLFGFTRDILVFFVNTVTTQVNLRMTCLQINKELVKMIYLLFLFWLFSKHFFLRNVKYTECEKQTKGICSLEKVWTPEGNPIQIH